MALIKIKQIEGLSGNISNIDSSINSLEGITTDISSDVTTNAGDIDSLEGSVNSLEGITTDISSDVTTNAGDIDSLEGSVNSLEAVVSTKLEASDLGDLETSVNSLEAITVDIAASAATNAGDIDDLEVSVNSLEGIAVGLANDIQGLVARENYGAEDVTGLSAVANAPLTVPFTPNRFGAFPYDYEVYVNGVKTIQAWVSSEFDGTNVELTLPYDVVEDDVFTIKAIELIP